MVAFGTIIIISQTQHVLTEEEYKEYNTLNDKKNLIEAYSIFYQSTGDLLRYITYNMLTENDIKRLSLTEECQTFMNAKHFSRDNEEIQRSEIFYYNNRRI